MSTENNSLRDSLGLIKGQEYPRLPDGRINWRAMLKPEHLYVNPDYEDELKTKFGVQSRRDIDVTKCADHELLVLLEGWRYLLRLRGVRSVDVKMDHVSDTKASATCTIELIGNFETNGQLERWCDVGSASLYSVSGSFQLHLEAMAANRAFARCARAALGVKIYGKDEYDPKANSKFEAAIKQGINPLIAKPAEKVAEESAAVAIKPQDMLSQLCAKLDKKGSHTFDKIKESAAQNKELFESDPSAWTDWESIPNRDVWTLLAKIKDKKGK